MLKDKKERKERIKYSRPINIIRKIFIKHAVKVKGEGYNYWEIPIKDTEDFFADLIKNLSNNYHFKNL